VGPLRYRSHFRSRFLLVLMSSSSRCLSFGEDDHIGGEYSTASSGRRGKKESNSHFTLTRYVHSLLRTTKFNSSPCSRSATPPPCPRFAFRAILETLLPLGPSNATKYDQLLFTMSPLHLSIHWLTFFLIIPFPGRTNIL